MFILFALAGFFWHLKLSRFRGWFASKSKRIGNIDAKTAGEKYLPTCDMQVQLSASWPRLALHRGNALGAEISIIFRRLVAKNGLESPLHSRSRF
jgi:hypothetical protein